MSRRAISAEENELAEVIRRAYMTGGFVDAARAVIAAGYERRRDVAEADALRKQRQG